MWLIQIDKDQYINALNIDAVNRHDWRGSNMIRVAVSQEWYEVHADYRDSFLNNLQAYNSNRCSNIVEGLTDKVNE